MLHPDSQQSISSAPDAPPPRVEPTPHPKRLSYDLLQLAKQAKTSKLSLAELEAKLRGRGFVVFMILMTVPFVLPVSIPGAALIMGLILAFMGLKISMGIRPWIPKLILNRTIPQKILIRILRITVRLSRRMESFTKPRLEFLVAWPGMMNLIGFFIIIHGLTLILPPPIINTLPACCILLFLIGIMERDGLMVLCGYLASFISIAYIWLIIHLGFIGVTNLQHLWFEDPIPVVPENITHELVVPPKIENLQ